MRRYCEDNQLEVVERSNSPTRFTSARADLLQISILADFIYESVSTLIEPRVRSYRAMRMS